MNDFLINENILIIHSFQKKKHNNKGKDMSDTRERPGLFCDEYELEEAFSQIRSVADAYNQDQDEYKDDGTPEAQRQIICAANLCSYVSAAIDHSGMFSDNEELDDIPTRSILYLLIDYYHSTLLRQVRCVRPSPSPQPPQPPQQQQQQQQQTDPTVERLGNLKVAKEKLRKFIETMQELKIVSAQDTVLVRQEDENDTMRGGDPTKRIAPRMDPGEQRTRKIAVYKRKAEMKRLLRDLNAKRKVAEEDQTGADEEAERERSLLMVRLCAYDAIDTYPMVCQEENMLEAVTKMKREGTFEEQQRRDREAWERKVRAAGGPAKPITILNNPQSRRLEMREGVFKNPYVAPLLSPSDAIDLEMDDALTAWKRERAEKEAAARMKKRIGADDNDDDDDGKEEGNSSDDDSDKETDKSLKKKREWDEFKDNNPRGWGNTYKQG